MKKKDKVNNGKGLPKKIRLAIYSLDNYESYQAEQQREYCVSYDDEWERVLFLESQKVEYIVEKEERLRALKKALESLSSEDRKMIEDNFFYDGNRPTYTELAKKHGISRQAYTKNLNRLLAKLRKIIEYYLSNE